MRHRTLTIILQSTIFLSAAYLRLIPAFYSPDPPTIISNFDGPVALTTTVSITPSASFLLNGIIVFSAALLFIAIRANQNSKVD